VNPLGPSAHLEAAAIVRASQSSFVPAFRLLPGDRRRDLETFYAFCRKADDLADLAGPAPAERSAALEAWRDGFRDAEMRGLPDRLRELIQRRALDRKLFLELLDGVATDLASSVRMATRADLDLYCHRVAGTVGRLCLPIFGADPTRAGPYAETLGRALQYTNILRDTAADLRRGRIYYPLDELASAGIADFPHGAETYLSTFAAQTEKIFAQAASLAPAENARALRPARLMAALYRTTLRKMRRDGLRVTEKRYRLSKPEKLWAIVRALAAPGGRASPRAA
jgi:phytoene/squalene synthetase